MPLVRPAIQTAAAWSVLVLAGAALVVAAGYTRDPAVVARAPWPLIGFIVASSVVFVLGFAVAARRGRAARLIAASLVGALLLGAVARVALQTYRAEALRRQVLAEPTRELQAAARHVIAGFMTMGEARSLARAGIGGLFLSPRNVRGKTIEAVAAEIAALQALRRDTHLPPLWIAADQEGGLVSNLSPPLPRPPALSSVAADRTRLLTTVDTLAVGLEAAGVNLDFAPVVDIGSGRVDPADRHSQIARRAIASDPALVASVADLTCRRLAAARVRCTIKHFPGIGAVTADTHVANAHLATIAAPDLAPFEMLTRPQGPHPWVMLGHVAIDDLDPVHPASASAAVIALLRRQLGYDGVLITDDAEMAVYRAALAENAVATLKGGADFVLASYDPDVAFEVIAAIVARARTDAALRAALAASDQRLARAKP